MTSTFNSFSAALLSLATAAAPAALASSSTAGTAQTPSPAPLVETPTQTDIVAQPAPVVEAAAIAAPSVDQRHVSCIAKVIMHEAAYEPRAGRVAVAQVIRARIRDGRFARDACGVARQRGQFFNVDAFDPPKNAAWHEAVEIAAHTLSGGGEDVVPGALYFHAHYSPMPGHARVGQIGGHVFYR